MNILKRFVKDSGGFIISAITLVAGLTWVDALNAIVGTIFANKDIVGFVVTAVIVTFVSVLSIYYITKTMEKIDEIHMPLLQDDN